MTISPKKTAFSHLIVLSLLLVACGDDDMVPGGDAGAGGDAAIGFDADVPGGELVARWAGVTTPTDFSFADGRSVRLDEIFEFRADGSMLGDFAGTDAMTRCVVTYRLTGAWSLDGDTLAADWTSIRSAVEGCDDPELDEEMADVTADEGDLWDDELDGVWSVNGDSMSIDSAGGQITYTRIRNPWVARWTGETSVDDLDFAQGRDVTFEETFWLNADGTMYGAFGGEDSVSGCYADYRLVGRWTLTGTDGIDVAWSSISAALYDCLDEEQDEPPTNVGAEERLIWDAELDGTWTVSGTTLRIVGPATDLEYQRAL